MIANALMFVTSMLAIRSLLTNIKCVSPPPHLLLARPPDPYFVFVYPDIYKPNQHMTLKQCWLNVGNVGFMLAHVLRDWPNIKPALDQCLVFAWSCDLTNPSIDEIYLTCISYFNIQKNIYVGDLLNWENVFCSQTKTIIYHCIFNKHKNAFSKLFYNCSKARTSNILFFNYAVTVVWYRSYTHPDKHEKLNQC